MKCVFKFIATNLVVSNQVSFHKVLSTYLFEEDFASSLYLSIDSDITFNWKTTYYTISKQL